MSSPPPPFIDPANPLIAPVPAQLQTGTVTTPDGVTLAVLTVRTASTTMTVLLTPDELGNWAGLISALHRSVTSGLAVPSAAETTIILDGNGRRRTR